MKPLERAGAATAMSLLLAGAGVVTPIIWDWYNGRAALELQLLRSTTIVERSSGLRDLEFVYKGVRVPGLTRHDFALVNTGRTSITASQLVQAPTIAIDSGQIVEVTLQDSRPKGILLNCAVDSTHRLLRVSFPLLNGRDAAFFSILTTSAAPGMEISSRIQGVRQLGYRDQREARTKAQPKHRTWAFYVVTLSTLFSFLMFLTGIYVAGSESAIKSAARAGVIRFPRGLTPPALAAVLRAAFSDHAEPEIGPLLGSLGAAPATETLSEERTEGLERSAFEEFAGMRSAWAAVLMGCLTAVGLWFVISRLG